VNEITNSTERNPSWEAKSRWANQIYFLLWSPKFNFFKGHFNGSSLSQMNPVHTLTMLSFYLWLCQVMCYLQVYLLTCVQISFLSHTCYISSPFHPPWFNHTNNIWWREAITPAACYILAFRFIHLSSNIFSSRCSLFWETLVMKSRSYFWYHQRNQFYMTCFDYVLCFRISCESFKRISWKFRSKFSNIIWVFLLILLVS